MNMEENKPGLTPPDQKSAGKETKQQPAANKAEQMKQSTFNDLLKNKNNTEGNKKPDQQPATANKEPSSAEMKAGQTKQSTFSDMLKNENNTVDNKQETIADKKTLEEKKSLGKKNSSATQSPEQMKEAMLKMEQENKELLEELMLVRQIAAQMNQKILQNILEEEKAITEKKSQSEKNVKSSMSTTFQEVRDSLLLKQTFLEEKCVETARSEAKEAQEKLRIHIDKLEKMVKSLADDQEKMVKSND